MKVIALLLLLLRVFCKWRPLGSVPLFSWLLASLGGEGCTREELGWDTGLLLSHTLTVALESLRSLTSGGPRKRREIQGGLVREWLSGTCEWDL